jgi:hypothetical protein
VTTSNILAFKRSCTKNIDGIMLHVQMEYLEDNTFWFRFKMQGDAYYSKWYLLEGEDDTI